MSVAYDLVIISNTSLGRQIALRAAGLKARVALVEIHSPTEQWLGTSPIYQQIRAKSDATDEVSSRRLSSTIAHLDELDSPAVLAALGIDVIQEMGEFCRLPRFGFAVGNRLLTGRAYLIAVGDETIAPDIPGIDRLQVYTRENLPENIFTLANRRWVIIGGNAVGVEFAQLLHQLGAEVTLAVKGDRILPQQDADIAGLLQQQMEAQGIKVMTQAPVTVVKELEPTKWLQIGDLAVETDKIFLAVRQYPQVAGLNLAGAGVELNRAGIAVNRKLQTTNPRIYACTSHQQSFAVKEAEIALHNALFCPNRLVDTDRIPTVVFSQPPLAQIGLTPERAKRVYGDKVLVLREYFKHSTAAQISGDLTGMCQLIARYNGEIVGAQVLGTGAIEIVDAIALQMQRKGKIQNLAPFFHIYPVYAEILARLSQIWWEATLKRNKWQAEMLDKFFDLRRGWSN